MKGLEEARLFYEEFGKEMIRSKFPEYENRIAVGLVGHGSECFGFDDEISRDHDWNKGFCMWIDDLDDIRIGVELAREYRALAGKQDSRSSALAEGNRGVRRTYFFYRRYTGCAGAPKNWRQWLNIPSHALAEATNGQVWRDDLGHFSGIREVLLNGMPEDVRKKKIAARAVEMAQSGQYNYLRCLKHGQEGAAMMALAEFVRASCDMIYMLNRAHMPYYKWMFKGMDKLEKLGNMKDALEYLMLGENDIAGQKTKAGVVEDISAAVINELRLQGLSSGTWDYLEPHAFDVMERIENAEIRALHIMEG